MATGIKQIAELANVSISTVSHVLNASAPISSQVQERVLSVARETGYLAKRRRKASISLLSTVLLVGTKKAFPKSDRNFVAWTMLNAFRKECQSRGIRLIPHIEEDEQIDPANVSRAVMKHRPQGIAVMQDDKQELIDVLAKLPCSSVILSGQDPSMRVDTVTPSNRYGAKLAVDHLLKLGHRNIGHLTWGRRRVGRQRTEGYLDALRLAGLETHPEMVIDVGDYQQDVVEDNMGKWLREHDGIAPYTAFFCSADNVALGAINALQNTGYNVPKDVSVTGFDNALFGELSNPPLTTMHVPMEEIGHVALNLLEEALTLPDGERSARRVELGCRLVERGSTAPPPAKKVEPEL
ncbi:LacI family DNA-binding transcriptional regulator [Pseudovibrio sp. Tun.PSC04-5.I4]|uniref:LacI family DNA-binding transcriptional regulator n=1 Tax=Pseudovibrio sp. Tun.PSC04-5.I4 TaxID=1798213 RepID=UPI00088D2866|nr:LacI family DNA-binding transcriptional regulator [Pseudovibrio sp. Tun.PSC04-5.I4]SDQ12477.1 DNA-binding transcriptional regulator, LacI/PurR family [Pseudovibrio sp. Tun.PSC04-5.I4]